MAYNKQQWQNNSKATPLSASRMSHIEEGLVAIDAVAAAAYEKAARLDDFIEETRVKLEALDKSFDGLVESKQDKLISGESIKTINEVSILGSGNIEISGGQEAASVGPQFKINGVPCFDTEVKLPVGDVYELSGELRGHILVEAAEGSAANTQLILNNVIIKSDIERAIYSNQTQKKLVITALEGTKNYFESAELEGDLLSSAVIEAENSLFFVTNKNSFINIKSRSLGHAIKAQSLYLDGVGTIEVEAEHDGFHGSRIIRVAGGTYNVLNAKDAFGTGAEGKIQVINGNINIFNCSEDGFDSQGEGGVIAGFDTKIHFGSVGEKKFNGVAVLETVPEISGYTDARVSLQDFYGPAEVKTASLDADGNLVLGAAVPLDENNCYNTSKTLIYLKGYIEHPVILSAQSTDVYFDNACLKGTEDIALLNYMPTSKKLTIRSVDDLEAVNYLINLGTGNCIKSTKNIAFQKDSSYILKSKATNMSAFEVTIRGDGVRLFDSAAENIICSTMYIGADKDAVESSKKLSYSEFATTALYCNNDILCEAANTDDGAVKMVYSQMGPVVCNAVRADALNKFYTGILVLGGFIQKEDFISLTLMQAFIKDDLRSRVKELENKVTALTELVDTLLSTEESV